MEPSDLPSAHEPLYRMREATVLLPDSGSIGPITWTVYRGQRIGVRCAHEAQWDALCALLSGQRTPSGGILDEVVRITVQSDVHLRNMLRRSDTLQAYLDAPDTPEFVWLDGRRRSVMVLVDLLGITPAMRRRPLKFADPETVDKVLALRFVMSQAALLIGREVFRSADPQVREALRRRWADWPGAVVVSLDDHPAPGALNAWVRIDAAGHFTAGDGPPDDVAGNPPASGAR